MADLDLASVARLIGDDSRSAMLTALMGGHALPAGDLARVAGVSPATASGHLARLLDGGLLTVISAGRHRYYCLAGPEVAEALEALAAISPPVPVRSLRQSRALAAMALARTCYDHLAGRVGVAIHDALSERGTFTGGYDLTPAGVTLLEGLGVDVALTRQAKRAFARGCLDVTERRMHLAGALGAALCHALMGRGWLVRRSSRDRGLCLTADGRTGLAYALGIRLGPHQIDP